MPEDDAFDGRFELVNEEKPQKEEDVLYVNDVEIEFKVIWTEMNRDYRNWLVLNR